MEVIFPFILSGKNRVCIKNRFLNKEKDYYKSDLFIKTFSEKKEKRRCTI